MDTEKRLEKLERIGSFLLVPLILIGICLIAALWIRGGVWLIDKVYRWLVPISAIALGITIFVLLPLAIFARTRGFSGMGMVIASYVFGATLWVTGLLTTYALWGGVAVFIGLFILGVGVVPIAMLATLFKAMWPELGGLLFLTAMVFGTRFFGCYLVAKAEESHYAYTAREASMRPKNGKATLPRRVYVYLAGVCLVSAAVGALITLAAAPLFAPRESRDRSPTSLLTYANGKPAAIIALNEAGKPVLTLLSALGHEVLSLGIEGEDGYLSLKRADGSFVSIGPNDDGPGYHVTLLKSLGEGQGVFMSTLTSDDLSIYQSRIGSILLGSRDSRVGLEILDSSEHVVFVQPKDY